MPNPPAFQALSQHPEFLELIFLSRADFAAGRTISMDEMRHRVLPTRSPAKRVKPPAPEHAAADMSHLSNKTQYQRMMRRLLDAYATHHSRPLPARSTRPRVKTARAGWRER